MYAEDSGCKKSLGLTGKNNKIQYQRFYCFHWTRKQQHNKVQTKVWTTSTLKRQTLWLLIYALHTICWQVHRTNLQRKLVMECKQLHVSKLIQRRRRFLGHPVPSLLNVIFQGKWTKESLYSNFCCRMFLESITSNKIKHKVAVSLKRTFLHFEFELQQCYFKA